MSYGIEFESVARRAFNTLEVGTQELVLDESDRLADAADLLPNRPLPLRLKHDVRAETPAGVLYVFLTVEYDPPKATLRVIRVGHHTLPRPS